MIKIKDVIITKYIKLIGATGFMIYSYLKMLDTERVRIFSIRQALGLSKSAVIQYLKKLKKYKLIAIKIKIEKGKKTLYIRILKIGRFILPLSSSNTIYNTYKTKPLRSKYRSIHNEIVELALSHRRFNNKYYRSRAYRFTLKEEKHVKRLTENVPSIKNYMKWWMKNKSFKMPGLNIGLICCVPMIEEYRLAMGWHVSKETKKEAAAKEKKIDKLKMEMLQALYTDVINAKKAGKKFKLTKLDKGLIKEGIDEGLLIKKDDGKLKLNF